MVSIVRCTVVPVKANRVSVNRNEIAIVLASKNSLILGLGTLILLMILEPNKLHLINVAPSVV